MTLKNILYFASMSIPVIGVLSMVRFDLLNRLIRSIDYPVEKVVIVLQGYGGKGVSNGKLELSNPLVKEYVVYTTDFNIGVSRGWNFIMRNHLTTFCIICGDDCYFDSGSLERISTRMQEPEELENVFISYKWKTGKDIISGGYISFIVTSNTIKKIGYFDENIYPAYYEDIDFHRRIELSKEKFKDFEDVFIFHGDDKNTGSCTLNSVSPDYRYRMDVCHARNATYYHEKWRSRDISESFPYPFNNSAYTITDQVPHENYYLNQLILLGHRSNPTITRIL